MPACHGVTEGVYCFGAFQGQSQAAFAWLATGDITAELNHHGDLRAGLPAFLPPDTGFAYYVTEGVASTVTFRRFPVRINDAIQ